MKSGKSQKAEDKDGTDRVGMPSCRQEVELFENRAATDSSYYDEDLQQYVLLDVRSICVALSSFTPSFNTKHDHIILAPSLLEHRLWRDRGNSKRDMQQPR